MMRPRDFNLLIFFLILAGMDVLIYWAWVRQWLAPTDALLLGGLAPLAAIIVLALLSWRPR